MFSNSLVNTYFYEFYGSMEQIAYTDPLKSEKGEEYICFIFNMCLITLLKFMLALSSSANDKGSDIKLLWLFDTSC